MFASLVVILALSVVIFAIFYAILVYLLNRRTHSDLELSYKDSKFAQRCLQQFAVCSEVIVTLTDTIRETLNLEDTDCTKAQHQSPKPSI